MTERLSAKKTAYKAVFFNGIVDGNAVIEEYNSSNTLQADYVMGSRIDEPLTMTRSSTTYYYNTDGLGNVRQVLNSSGTIVESYDYDPYGQVTIYNSSLTDITSSGSGIDNPYMYTGRRLDEETGIYHYRLRAYDPSIGRFLQRDPLGYYDSMNLYEYVGSNPINFVDPLGLMICPNLLESEEEKEPWEELEEQQEEDFQECIESGECDNTPGTTPEEPSTYDQMVWGLGGLIGRVFGPFSPNGLPNWVQRARKYFRLDRPHHGKPWHFDGEWIKKFNDWFKPAPVPAP